jgi:ATP-binding cassette, subfamily B, bacterial CvaB/MchF/RaxB
MVSNAFRALFHVRRTGGRTVLQTENAECGLACIAMIAAHHGYDIDLVSLRQRYPISGRGSDLADLVDIAGDLHLNARALKAEIFELRDVELPCILHWGMDHFVVLSRIRKNAFVVLDPARGERHVSAAEFDANFSGVLLELSPATSFQRAQLRKRLKLTDLWSSARGIWSSLGQVLVLSLLLQIFAVVAPLYMQSIVDVVIYRDQWDLLTPIAIGFGMLVVTQSIIGLLRSYAILHLSNRLSVQMGANLFHHLVRLPLGYFLKRHLGDILSRFQSLHRVRQTMTTGIVGAWLDGLMALITLSVMLYYSVLLTAIVLGIVVLYVALRVVAFNRVKALRQEQLIAGANESSHFMETVRAMQTLKIFQKESERQNEWVNRLTAVVNKDTAIGKWDAGFATLNAVLFGLENIVVIYVCALLVRQHEMSLGMLFAFVSFKASFSRAIGGLITQVIDFMMLDIHFERISDIVFTPKEAEARCISVQTNQPYQAAAREISGRIEVRNLTFRYEGSKRPVFTNVSFVVDAGETLAITGPSGCGKTTLLKCLMGLLEPTDGVILVDGKPLETIPVYRSQIAGVMQDDQLVSGSIKHNIAFSAEVSLERMRECAKLACVHEDIMAMPMQYDTLVGDLGASLSGGQKQRVILARALYRGPRILFMDEATSHLDVESEAAVNRQISRLSMTRILIAHRPETVRAAGKRIDMAEFGVSVDLESQRSQGVANA